MAIQIGAVPDAGFENPVAMLRDCHRRILRFADVLARVARDARGCSLSREQQDAVKTALHYFSTSGPIHSQDEEQSLFPRLTGRVPGEVVATIATLELEHREAEEQLLKINRLFRGWIADFSLPLNEEETLLRRTMRLEAHYNRHIQIEEATVFTAADAMLNPGERTLIGREFAARRKS